MLPAVSDALVTNPLLKGFATPPAASAPARPGAESSGDIRRLAGAVAHDVNNILNAIVGYSELLHSRLGHDAECRHDLAEIERAARRAADLIGELLVSCRPRTPAPASSNLNQVLEGLQRMLGIVLGRHIRVVTRLAPEMPRVSVSCGRLEQVVVNLAVNARDAMPAGGTVTIATDIVALDVSTPAVNGQAPAGRYVRLEVRDTGIGMDCGTLSRAFEPFFTTKPEGKGTGLGLLTVYEVAAASGGFVSVDSAPGAGTAVQILWPAA